MDSNNLPLWKALDAPLISLDESHVELFSLLCLFLLTLVALLVRGKHRQLVRHLVQLTSLAVFFYIVYSCLGVFGMIRNLMHGTTLIGTIFTESFFWMSLPLTVIAFSVTTGPYFCGWICPTGTFQELVAMARENAARLIPKKQVLRLSKVRYSPVTLIALALFFAGFLGLVFWLGSTRRFYVEDSSLYWAASLILLVFLVLTRWADDQAIRAIRAVSFTIIVGSALLKTAIISPVHFAFADVSDPASALTTLVLVVASVFIARSWCRYICPWGYLMGCIHRVSRLQLAKNSDCEQCGKCSKVCRVDAIQKGKVVTNQCQFCMACLDRCPQKALEIVDVWKRDKPEQ